MGFIDVALQPINAEAFKPFGRVIEPGAAKPNFSTSFLRSWKIDFEAENGTELHCISYEHQPFICREIERHFTVSQTFIPLGGAASVLVVAAPTERGVRPGAEDLRAFYVPGSIGIVLGRATWHALTRFPAHPGGATFVMLTGTDTQREMETLGKDEMHFTETIDVEKLWSAPARVFDPRGILEAR